MGDNDLFLGHDLADRARIGLDPDHLTTHAACLGMTGSGKTGLGIVALEELARRGTPLLVIDLKGDMVNLLLNFPSLEASAFEPWLARDTVAGRSRADAAEEQARLWRDGLAGSGLSGEDMHSVRNGVTWRLLTPGAAGIAPLDILPSLSAPTGWSPDSDPDGATERVGAVAGALLSLVGRGGDPLTNRDQVLLASILLEHWRRGERVDLAGLLGSVADPPMAALGALPVERFYPRHERMKLVLELNALLASPAFGAWTTGAPLSMVELLGSEGEPRASIVSIAHLDERQRLFILALLASELVAWMRRQPGSSSLRALLYIDELQGILPPHPANPPTKLPLLTLLKQGRAFGVGVWLASQNPVDVDYKALGNAGVTLIGRLVTERDRERVLDGLALRTLDDGRDADALIAGLG
jgi:DNA helicase HerA-like ATPase